MAVEHSTLVMASPSRFHNGFWGFAIATAAQRLKL